MIPTVKTDAALQIVDSVVVIEETDEVLDICEAQHGQGEAFTDDTHTLVVLEHGSREEVHHGLFNDVVKGASSFCAQKQREHLVALHHIADSHGENVVALNAAGVIDTGFAVQTTNGTLVQNKGGQGLLAGTSFQRASRSVAPDGSIRIDVSDKELDPSKILNGRLEVCAFLLIISRYSVEKEDMFGNHVHMLEEGLI